MMKKLVVFGAAFHDVVKLVEAINRVTPTWDLLGFLDDTPERQDQHYRGYPVLGGREMLKKFGQETETYVYNNVFGTWKRTQRVAGMLEEAGCNVASLVHPSVDLNDVTLGRGCYLTKGVTVGGDSQIGDFVKILANSVIGHDVTIEDYAFLAQLTSIGSYSILKAGCFLGAGAIVTLKRTVGFASTIGAGAVVTRDVADGVQVFGVPARPKGEASD